MPTMIYEGVYAGEAILSEAEGMRSRDVAVVDQNQTLLPGSVVATITAAGGAKGRIVAYNPAGADGSQTATGVTLHKAITIANQTVKVTVFTRSCEVKTAALQWAAGVTPAQQATAIAALAGLGIIARS